MKKLKLRALELDAREVLTRTQLKTVLGGSGSGGGCLTSECTSDSGCSDPKFPHCYISTCVSTGAAANYCGVKP